MQNSKLTTMDKNDIEVKSNGKKEKEEERNEDKEKVNAEIEELKNKVEDLDNKYKRALADYQNLEKRVRQERSDWFFRANKDLLLHLLPVLDTLILTKKHSKVEDEGLDLSIKQFKDLLKEEGVEKIDAVGKQFDPKLMQCVETREGEDGKVLEETRPGYKLHDTVLQVALVTVGKGKV